MRVAACVSVLSLGLLMQCSNSGNPSLAGGAGAGNPGRATFAMAVETGTLDSSAAAKAVARDDDDRVEVVDVAGNRVTITSATVAAQWLRFVGNEACEGPGQSCPGGKNARVEGPFMFDLLAKTAQPMASADSLPAGVYRGIEIHVAKDSVFDSASGGEPPCCAVRIEGAYETAAGNRAFAILLPIDEHVQYAQDPPVTVEAGETVHFVLALDVRQWFSEIDIAACTDLIDDSGAVIIGGPQNACVQTRVAFKQSFIHSGRLRRR
jgi:hypothetical protein